ncbi:hypothetical protein HK096_007492, partial [Nowakowskiella sp. JEL0078]
ESEFPCKWKNLCSRKFNTKNQALMHLKLHIPESKGKKSINPSLFQKVTSGNHQVKQHLSQNTENTQISYMFGPNGPIPVWIPTPTSPVSTIVLTILRNWAKLKSVKAYFERGAERELVSLSSDTRFGAQVCVVLGELEFD